MDPKSNWKEVSILMLLCGTWPTELTPGKYRAFYKVAKIFPSIFFFVFLLSLTYGLYSVITQGDVENLPPSISLYITNLIVSTKTLICQFGGIQRMIKLCVEHDTFLSKTEDEAILKIRRSNIVKAKLFMKAFIFYTPFMGMLFILTHFMEYYVFWNEDKAKDVVRQLPYHSYLPFDSNEHYLWGLVCNAVSAYFVIVLYISSDVMLISFLFSISIRLQILQNFLRNLDKYAGNIRQIHGELTEEQAVFVTIRLCIIEHQNIMKLVIELNSYINFLLLLEFFTNSMQLAANLLAIMESLNLSQAICDSNYYNFNKKSKDCLRLMLLAKLLLNHKKINRKYLKQWFISFLRSETYGLLFGIFTISPYCIYSKLFGEIGYYTACFMPGCLAGLSLLVEDKENRIFDTIAFVNWVIEAGINNIRYFNLFNFNTTREGSIRYLTIGYALNLFKMILPKLGKIVASPKVLLSTVFDISNVKFGVFLSAYVTLYRYVSCFLVKKDRRQRSWHAALAGLISGATYLISPNIQILIISMTTILQVSLWGFFSKNKEQDIGRCR
ncbi:unnamed protein product [Brassicogethes aeneus]|uniref:Odorant receptor n=1 Tax=Brassicogethes aeneus TaxID=1431903 RepID=A0A9P0B0X3_BRAAE|nr:unnamed protein product [Brassicogethes aeneus]